MYLNRLFAAILFLMGVYSCNTGGSDYENTYHPFSKELQKTFSPDKRCYFTIKENGDSASVHTQLMLMFKHSGAGVYTVNGTNKKIKAYWKDNHTIVIQTYKQYEATQKWPQVQSFSDIVKIEYEEK